MQSSQLSQTEKITYNKDCLKKLFEQDLSLPENQRKCVNYLLALDRLGQDALEIIDEMREKKSSTDDFDSDIEFESEELPDDPDQETTTFDTEACFKDESKSTAGKENSVGDKKDNPTVVKSLDENVSAIIAQFIQQKSDINLAKEFEAKNEEKTSALSFTPKLVAITAPKAAITASPVADKTSDFELEIAIAESLVSVASSTQAPKDEKKHHSAPQSQEPLEWQTKIAKAIEKDKIENERFDAQLESIQNVLSTHPHRLTPEVAASLTDLLKQCGKKYPIKVKHFLKTNYAYLINHEEGLAVLINSFDILASHFDSITLRVSQLLKQLAFALTTCWGSKDQKDLTEAFFSYSGSADLIREWGLGLTPSESSRARVQYYAKDRDEKTPTSDRLLEDLKYVTDVIYQNEQKHTLSPSELRVWRTELLFRNKIFRSIDNEDNVVRSSSLIDQGTRGEQIAAVTLNTLDKLKGYQRYNIFKSREYKFGLDNQINDDQLTDQEIVQFITSYLCLMPIQAQSVRMHLQLQGYIVLTYKPLLPKGESTLQHAVWLCQHLSDIESSSEGRVLSYGYPNLVITQVDLEYFKQIKEVIEFHRATLKEMLKIVFGNGHKDLYSMLIEYVIPPSFIPLLYTQSDITKKRCEDIIYISPSMVAYKIEEYIHYGDFSVQNHYLNYLDIFDISSGTRIARIMVNKDEYNVDFHTVALPNHDIITVTPNSVIKWEEIASGKPVAVDLVKWKEKTSITAACLSADKSSLLITGLSGDVVSIGLDDKIAKVVYNTGFQNFHIYTLEQNKLCCIGMPFDSEDSENLDAFSKYYCLVNCETGDISRHVTSYNADSVAMSHCILPGNHIAVMAHNCFDYSDNIHIINLETNKIVCDIQTQTRVYALTTTYDGNFLVSSEEDRLEFFDAHTFELVYSMPLNLSPNVPRKIYFNPFSFDEFRVLPTVQSEPLTFSMSKILGKSLKGTFKRPLTKDVVGIVQSYLFSTASKADSKEDFQVTRAYRV